MNDKNMLFETLKELIDNQETGKRKDPSYIYLDDKDNQIKEIPLSKLNLDSSASALINSTINEVKELHDFIFSSQL